MYYILKEDIKDFGALIKALKKRNLVRCEYSYNGHNAFGVATYFNKTEANEFIVLSERMCCCDPQISWITTRIKCESEEEFLQKVDEKIEQQIKNRT